MGVLGLKRVFVKWKVKPLTQGNDEMLTGQFNMWVGSVGLINESYTATESLIMCVSFLIKLSG